MFVLFLQIYFFLATLISLFLFFAGCCVIGVQITNNLINHKGFSVNFVSLSAFLTGTIGFFWLWTLVH